ERSDPGRGVLQLDLVAVERRRDALWVYRHRDAAVHLDPGATADLDRGGRIAGRERLRHGLGAGVAVVDAERLERLEEALLRFAQRHTVLRTPRPRQGGLDVAEVELHNLRILRLDGGVVPERVLLAVRLDQRDVRVVATGQAQVRDRLVIDREAA